MTHEFKYITEAAIKAKKIGLKSVLASVVDLDGSSYRRPGVRMLILEDDTMVGAVSGGCVEKEILLQSQSVFKTGISKIMTYDGRYRLGCEGVLYILLEQVNFEATFETTFFKCLKERKTFEVVSYYEKKQGIFENIGSEIKIDNNFFSVSNVINKKSDRLIFSQKMLPCFKLIIIGSEHDAVQLSHYAALTGWEVTIVSSLSEVKSIGNFPKATALIATTPEDFDTTRIDNQTAVVLMTHNFAYDLRYLVALKDTLPDYVGLLGPTKRRKDLLSQFIEYCPEISDEFFDSIYGPAGLNIGSETPQEIAISIVSEILAVTRKRNPISLSEKTGSIHAKF